MKELIEKLLVELGEDPSREGLQNTPERVANSMKFLTGGYWVNIDELVNDALFEDPNTDEMVIIKDIDVFSLCEHHMLPFFGKCHVARISRMEKSSDLVKFREDCRCLWPPLAGAGTPDHANCQQP